MVFGLTPSVHWGFIASPESFQLFVYYLAGMYVWLLVALTDHGGVP